MRRYLLTLVPDQRVPLGVLSPVEQEVVWMLVLAKGPKWIADAMHMSHFTFVKHLQHIMSCTGLHSRAELTRWAQTTIGSMSGDAVPHGMHPDGCPCFGWFCTMARQVKFNRDLADQDRPKSQRGRIILPALVPVIADSVVLSDPAALLAAVLPQR